MWRLKTRKFLLYFVTYRNISEFIRRKLRSAVSPQSPNRTIGRTIRNIFLERIVFVTQKVNENYARIIVYKQYCAPKTLQNLFAHAELSIHV